jgi:hypothetical protein
MFETGTLTVWVRVLNTTNSSETVIATGAPKLLGDRALGVLPPPKSGRASGDEVSALRRAVSWVAPRVETTIGETKVYLFVPAKGDVHSNSERRPQLIYNHVKAVAEHMGFTFDDRQIAQYDLFISLAVLI